MNKKFIQSLITITKTRAEIERLESENNCGTSDFIEAKRIVYNRVKRILDSLPEQPASESSEKIGQLNVLPKSARHSEGLEEAAENIYKTPFGTRSEDFKAGAEWMKAKMMKDAVEGVVCYGSKGAYIETDFLGEYDTDVYGNSGDKVRVIVIKEDK